MEHSDKSRIQTLAVLVDNEPGVLSQVARLFSRKGFNIESIAAGTAENPYVTRLTIDVLADEHQTEFICNQLSKLFPVRSVKLLNSTSSIYRELMLIKVGTENAEERNEIIQLASLFRASIIDVSRETLTLEITGDEDKISAITNILKDYNILEVVRTGGIALERGKATINDESKERGEFNYGKNVL